jgi:hypothetical protein
MASSLAFLKSASVPACLENYLLTIPELVPVQQPVIARADCEGAFAHRLGAALIFSVRSFVYFLSPSGEFWAVSKLFLRWFIFLMTLTISIGLPTLVAATFVASISNLLYLAAQQFFYSIAYFVGACMLLAVGITLLLSVVRRS